MAFRLPPSRHEGGPNGPGDRVAGHDGAWRVVEEDETTVVLKRVPEPSMDEVHAGLGSRPASRDEFEDAFGHLPTDAEG
jgi:hypothetical protein